MKFIPFIYVIRLYHSLTQKSTKSLMGRDARHSRKNGQKKSTRLRGRPCVFYLLLGSQVQSSKIRSSRSRTVFKYVIRISRSFPISFDLILTRPNKLDKPQFSTFSTEFATTIYRDYTKFGAFRQRFSQTEAQRSGFGSQKSRRTAPVDMAAQAPPYDVARSFYAV